MKNYNNWKRKRDANPSVFISVAIPISSSIITPLSSPLFPFLSCSLSFLHVQGFKLLRIQVKNKSSRLSYAVSTVILSNPTNLFLSRFSHFLCFLKTLFFNLKYQRRKKNYKSGNSIFNHHTVVKTKDLEHTSLLESTSSTTCFAYAGSSQIKMLS